MTTRKDLIKVLLIYYSGNDDILKKYMTIYNNAFKINLTMDEIEKYRILL